MSSHALAAQLNLLEEYARNSRQTRSNQRKLKEFARRQFADSVTIGRPVSLDTFLLSIFRDLFDTAPQGMTRKAHLVELDTYGQPSLTRCCTRLPQLIKHAQSGAYTHFSSQLYFHNRKRTKDELLLLPAIGVDLDLRKDGSGRLMSPDEVSEMCLERIGVAPAYVWMTKTSGNYQVVWLLKPLPARHPRRQALYHHIAQAMAKAVGGDEAFSDVVRLYRLPQDRSVWEYTPDVHDIDVFKHLLPAYESRQWPTQGNVHNLSQERILRHPAIRCLMNAEFLSDRNHACFTLALLFKVLGWTKDEAQAFLAGEWFGQVNDGRFASAGHFGFSEVYSSVRSAYRPRYHGPTRHWIKRLTGIDFPFRLYQSSYIRTKYKSSTEVRDAVYNFLRSNGGQTIVSQTTFAKECGMPLRSVQRALSAMEKEGTLTLDTRRGRNGGTTITLIEGIRGLEINTPISHNSSSYALGAFGQAPAAFLASTPSTMAMSSRKVTPSADVSPPLSEASAGFSQVGVTSDDDWLAEAETALQASLEAGEPPLDLDELLIAGAAIQNTA